MRRLLYLLAVYSLAPATAAAETPAAMARAEQCLKDHVRQVVAEEADPAVAASRLVNVVCAEEVRIAANFLENTVRVRQYSSLVRSFSAEPAASGSPGAKAARRLTWDDVVPSVDPETGEIVYPPSVDGAEARMTSVSLDLLAGSARLSGDMSPQPADLRAAAGKLVMSARRGPER